MTRLASVASLLLVLALANLAQAADDPTGTWKWSTMFNNQTREQTLKLKLEGDKLTGALVGRNNSETAIEDGTYKDGEISFKITRERGDRKFTTTYKGKVEGDKITGTIESPGRDGQSRSREWTATRSKE